MNHDEAHKLIPGTIVVTAYPPRAICRFVRIVKSQWCMQLELLHRHGGFEKGGLSMDYYSGVETLEEASICGGKHEDLGANGVCMRCGFSREAQAWERGER